jgi:hypothetical protein
MSLQSSASRNKINAKYILQLHPDWLRYPPSLLLNRYRGSCPEIDRPGVILTTYSDLAPSYKYIPHLSLYGFGSNNFTVHSETPSDQW